MEGQTTKILAGVFFELALPYTDMEIVNNSPERRTLRLKVGEHPQYLTSIQFHPRFQPDILQRFAKVPKGAEQIELLEIGNNIFTRKNHGDKEKFIDGRTGEILTFREILERNRKAHILPIDFWTGRMAHSLKAWGHAGKAGKSRGILQMYHEAMESRHEWLSLNRSWAEKRRDAMRNGWRSMKARIRASHLERKESLNE